jgi:hypothetical protein
VSLPTIATRAAVGTGAARVVEPESGLAALAARARDAFRTGLLLRDPGWALAVACPAGNYGSPAVSLLRRHGVDGLVGG